MTSRERSDPASSGIGAISAVVCNYNGEAYLADCIEALLRSEHPIDEILVVDNRSTDDSLKLLAERFPSASHPSLRVLDAGSNGGPALARNLGMRAARHSWVLALDNDAFVSPQLLGRMVQVAERRPDAVILQPRSVFAHEPERVHYDGGWLHYAGLVSLRNFYRPLSEAEGEDVVELDVAVSVCLLLNRDTVLAAGGYDETYFILFEDLDLSCRLRLAGHAILSVEDALVRHDVGTPGISFREGTTYPSRRIFFHSRNRWLYLLKCYRWRTLVCAGPGLLLYEFVWFAFAIRQGALGAWMHGKWQVFCLLPQLRAKRRVTQRTRVRADRELFVGGPLTLTPSLHAGKGSLFARWLDRLLALWWQLLGPLSG